MGANELLEDEWKALGQIAQRAAQPQASRQVDLQREPLESAEQACMPHLPVLPTSSTAIGLAQLEADSSPTRVQVMAQVYTRLLRVTPALTALDLASSSLGDEGLSAVGAALACGCAPRLQLLQLSRNIDSGHNDRGLAFHTYARAIGRALASGYMADLKQLSLSFNALSDRDVLDVFAGLHGVPRLAVLDLSFNGLGASDSGLPESPSMWLPLQHVPQLTDLLLHGNSIRVNASVSAGLSFLGQLQVLNLAGNVIDSDGKRYHYQSLIS
jgi:Leucine-rich repeat (LRR) protein